MKKYEGGIKEFSVDDKGVVAVIGFGLPPFGHEDDATRGIHAAFDITNAVIKIENKINVGITSRMGVTSGDVFCGSVGSASRREFAMIGDTVNLAARLMMKADTNGVLCDNYTYMEAKSAGKFSFERLAPIKLKGKEQLVPIFKPTASTVPSDMSKFHHEKHENLIIVGRSQPQAELQQQVDLLYQGGNGGAVLIVGHAGIGKSVLLKDVAKMAAAKPITTYTGAGDSLESSTPYYVWRHIFAEALELKTLTDKEQRRLHVKYLAGEDPALLGFLPLLNAVVPLELPENDETSSMSKTVRGTATQRLLLRLLQNMVLRNPKILLMEDLHLLDSASWSLLIAAVGEISPILIVCASRPAAVFTSDSMRVDFKTLCRFEHLHIIELEPLESQQAISLVCNLLEVNSLPKQVSDIIIKQGQGNPFFCEQITRMLKDSGQIRIQHGKCKLIEGLNENSSIAVPDTVQGIITSRIDRLNQNEQATLRVASVIGCSFSLALLRSVHPGFKDLEAIKITLNGLVAADIIREVSPGHYEFRNLISQEVGYNQMLFAHRKELHLQIGKWYEREKADILSTSYTLLAHHWVRAENYPKSFEYLEKAGMQALGNHGNQEAVNFLSQALKLDAKIKSKDPTFSLNPPMRLAGWEAYLGRAHLALGNIVEGRSHLETCLSMLGLPLPKSSLSRTWSTFVNGVKQFRLRVFPFTPSPFIDEERRLYAAHAYGWLFEIYFFGQNHQLAMNAALKAINCSEEANLLSELSRGFANMSVAAENCRMYSLASAYNILSRKLASNMDTSCQAWVLVMAATQHLSSGKFVKAKSELTHASTISETLGDRRRWEESYNTLALTYFLLGDNKTSFDLCKKVHDSGKSRGDIQTQSWGMLGQARSLATRGHLLDECLNVLQARDKMLEEHAGRRTRVSELNAYGVRALTYMRKKDVRRAMNIVDEAINVIQGSATPNAFLYPGYACVMDVIFHVMHDTEKISDISELNQTQLRRMQLSVLQAWRRMAHQIPIGKPRYLLAQALHKIRTGNINNSVKLTLQQAFESAEQFGMKYEAAVTMYYLARVSPADSSERGSYLNTATNAFNAMKCNTAINECQKYAAECNINLNILGSFNTSKGTGLGTLEEKVPDDSDMLIEGEVPQRPRRRSSVFRDYEHRKRHESAAMEPKVRPVLQSIQGLISYQTAVPNVADVEVSPVGEMKRNNSNNERSFDVYPEQLESLKKEIDHLLTEGGAAMRIISVEGEAGIGKTKLMNDLRYYARTRHINNFLGAGNKFEIKSPYYSWRMIFEDMMGLPKSRKEMADQIASNNAATTDSKVGSVRAEDDLIRTQRSKILKELAGEHELLQLLPLINIVTPLDFKENDTTASLDSGARAEKTVFLLTKIATKFLSSNKSGNLVVFEDAQWLDPHSLALIKELTSVLKNVLIIFAIRLPLTLDPDSILPSLVHSQVSLESLSKTTISKLVCEALNVNHIGIRLQEFLFKIAEGHPYFSISLAVANKGNIINITEEGGDLIADMRDTVRHIPTIPPSTTHAILSRIDGLTSTQQNALIAASVIGCRFNAATLSAISGINAGDLAPDLLTLAKKGYVKVCVFDKVKYDLCTVPLVESIDILAPNLLFVFHNLCYLVARNLSVTNENFQKMHKALAAHIEFTHATNLAPMFTVLDHHWWLAGSHDNALFFRELSAAAIALPYSAYQMSAVLISHHTRLDRVVDELGKSFQITNKQHSQIMWYGLVDLNISRKKLRDAETVIRKANLASSLTYSKFNAYSTKMNVRFTTPRKVSDKKRDSTADNEKLTIARSFLTIASSCLDGGRMADAEYYTTVALSHAVQCTESLELAQCHALSLFFKNTVASKSDFLRHAERCMAVAKNLLHASDSGKSHGSSADASFASHSMSSTGVFNRLGCILLSAGWAFSCLKLYDKALQAINDAFAVFKMFHHWPMVNICKHRIVEIKASIGHIGNALKVNSTVDVRISKDFDVYNRTTTYTMLELLTQFWKVFWSTLLQYRMGRKTDVAKCIQQMQDILNLTVRSEVYDSSEQYIWLETLGWDINNELPSYLTILSECLSILANIQSSNYGTLTKDVQVFLNLLNTDHETPLVDDVVTEMLIIVCRLQQQEKSPLQQVPLDKLVAQLRASISRQNSATTLFGSHTCLMLLREGQLHQIQGNITAAKDCWTKGLKDAQSSGQQLVMALIQQEMGKFLNMKAHEEESKGYFTRIDASYFT